MDGNYESDEPKKVGYEPKEPRKQNYESKGKRTRVYQLNTQTELEIDESLPEIERCNEVFKMMKNSYIDQDVVEAIDRILTPSYEYRLDTISTCELMLEALVKNVGEYNLRESLKNFPEFYKPLQSRREIPRGSYLYWTNFLETINFSIDAETDTITKEDLTTIITIKSKGKLFVITKNYVDSKPKELDVFPDDVVMIIPNHTITYIRNRKPASFQSIRERPY